MAIQKFARWCFTLAGLYFAFNTPLNAQTEPAAKKGLFETEEVLAITLRGPMRRLLNNRINSPQNYPLQLSYSQDNIQWSIPVEVRTRGHFRRQSNTCQYPPLLIQFPTEGLDSSSVFREQRKLKLVMPCKEDDYVIREWLVYRMYNLLTPQSFRARLVKVTLEEADKKPVAPFYGILLEEDKQMARRNQMVDIERKVEPVKLQRAAFLRMAVFEFLIGNTDWSAKYLHNIKLMATAANAVPVAVPYDFDHAGIVDAPYARPAVELQMNSIRQRRYRGFCVSDIQTFAPVIEQFNQVKKDIYQLYTQSSLLDDKYIKSTVQYLDEFYMTINNPKIWQKEFSYPCALQGTSNVVIKGLKKD